MSDTASTSSNRLARLAGGAIWPAVAAVVVALLVPLRGGLDKAHLALVFLLVVLGATVRGGRVQGIVMSVLTFGAFNYFFLPPYYTFRIANPLDWIVLFTFLATSVVTAQLLSRAAREAQERIRLAGIEADARALREADRMKDRLIASVSHDIRTPLTTVKALALELAAGGDERALVIAQEADRLGRFAGDLLDLSRLESGALALRPEVNAAEDVLGAAIQRVSGAVGGREVRASIDTSAPLLLARLDFVATLRILVNLIDNAHKYSPPGAPIDLSAVRRGDRVVFAVGDHGPGVPAADRARIFESYYRVEGTGADGAGLGLAIAAALARAQGGELRHDPRPGGGSVFSFIVPAAEMPQLTS